MIYCYFGEFRQGKTMSAVWDLLHHMYFGRRCISNIPIEADFDPFLKKKKHLKAEYYEDSEQFLQEWIKSRGTAVFIDEMAAYMSNMDNSILKRYPNLINMLAQVEHYHLDLFYTVQKFKQSASRIRENSTHIVECSKLPLGLFTIYKNVYFNSDYFNAQGLPRITHRDECTLGSRIIWPSDFRRSVIAYNTYFEMNTQL